MEACMTAFENLVSLVNDRIDTTDLFDYIEPALKLSLSAFNMVPHITYFTFEDEENINQLSDILVTYACYVLVTKQVASVHNWHERMSLARELWNNWHMQANDLKQSESFYEDFVREPEE
jgi:hypothetical protein